MSYQELNSRLQGKEELKDSDTQGLAASLLVRALKQMKSGHLVIEMADGSRIDLGEEPAANPPIIRIKDKRFWSQCLLYSHIGFAEAYIKGYWTSPNLKEVITWFILNLSNSTVLDGSARKSYFINFLQPVNRLLHLLNGNSVRGSRKNIQAHYDLSNDFFALFLDKSMTYSSGRFSSKDQSLEEAQICKMEAILAKLRLKKTDHLLEIGSGWGALAIMAAKRYGCRVSTVTISRQQFELASKRIAEAGLEGQIEVKFLDYRHLSGSFDKIVSVEMIEAVGDNYLDDFFAKLESLLKPKGILVMQMILCPDSRFKILKDNVDFIQKHIFPGSLLPSLERVMLALRRTGTLQFYEIEDLGLSYERTLDLWREAFLQNLPALKQMGFDEEFILKWNYYFEYCSAAFATRNISVAQIVFSRPNNPELN